MKRREKVGCVCRGRHVSFSEDKELIVELVQTTTADGVRLDGMFQAATLIQPPSFPVDGVCFVHGTGGNFYSSTMFDQLAERFLLAGCGVLRVNTRGHDGISTSVTKRGGQRLGAAYEIVDDCRHDISAWLDWLRQRTGPRIALLGHSLGAVKCIYAMSRSSLLPVTRLIAISPPRLAYSVFCASPQGQEFLEAYHRAEQLVQTAQPAALMEVRLPLPFVITAGGYVEKYGPDERYNFLSCLRGLSCPTLFTFGSIEVENNMAFHGVPDEIESASAAGGMIQVVTIPGADHFYSATRKEIGDCIVEWLMRI